MNRILGDLGGTTAVERGSLSTLVRRRILCASDMTPRSERAIRRAAMVARQMNAEVLFVHVVGDRQPGRVVNLKANRARVRLMLQAERAMAHAPEMARVEIHLGKPMKVIAQLAKEWDADLVVLAAPVPRRYERLLGTTAERIIRSVDRPVLVVSAEADTDYAQVAIATDLSLTSVRAAQAVARMGLVEKAHSWIVHAFDPPDRGMSAEARMTPEQVEAYKQQWEQLVTSQLTPDLTAAGFDLARVRILAQPAPPLAAIEEILEKTQPDLLVIGTSRWPALKRMLDRSVAHQVLSNVRCDILALSASSAQRENEAAAPIAMDGFLGREIATDASTAVLNT